MEDVLVVARFLWPKFSIRDGAVLATDLVGDNSQPVNSFPSLTEAEALLNHIHVLDVFDNCASSTKEPFYDSSHPDFRAACELGVVAAQCWAAKLRADFPRRAFRVYYTQNDNPVVRFHQVREGEPVFLEEGDCPNEINEGRVIVHAVQATG